MKNKVILVSTVAVGLCAGAALASGVQVAAPIEYFNGWYAGAGVGVEHLTGSVDRFTDRVESIDGITREAKFSAHDDIGDTSLDGGIFAGYGQVLNTAYYLGAEAFARYAHLTATNSSFSERESDLSTYNSLSVDTKWAYGAALKFGYLPTAKTMIYVLAGVETAKFDCHGSHAESGSEGFSHDYDFDKQAVAFMPGVGIETMLTDKISLRGQYTYADYSNFSHHATFTEENGQRIMTNFAYDDKVDPERGLFTLDVTYRWNGV